MLNISLTNKQQFKSFAKSLFVLNINAYMRIINQLSLRV